MMWNIDGITWPGKLFTPWDRSSRDREPASRSWRRREAVTRDRVALRQVSPPAVIPPTP